MSVGIGTPAWLKVISTVVLAAGDYSLTTLPQVKDQLSITDSSQDSVLTADIATASAAISQYCNRIFAVETVKDTFFPQRDLPVWTVIGGLEPLQLSRWPVVSVATVVEAGVTLTVDVDYMLDAAKGQIIRLDANGYPQRWPIAPIVVTFDAGYASIPADIQAAATRMVSQRHFARIRDPLIKSEKIEGIGQIDYIIPYSGEGNMTQDVVDLLDNYRVPVVA